MKKETAAANGAERKDVKKKGSKKPLVALVIAAMLGLGAYGGAQYYNENIKDANVSEQQKEKEKVTIQVNAEKVSVNGAEQALPEGKTWKVWLEEYFAKKDLANTEVTVDFAYGDSELVKEIKEALSALKITTTEK